jgi:integrase
MPLSDAAVRNAKPRAKPYKLSDSAGLYLQVQPNGSKLWRHKYRHLGKEKKLSFGPYPEISLSEARRRRDAAREQLYSGLDPSREKAKARQHAEVVAGCSFTLVAEEYCSKRKRDGANAWAPATASRCEYLLCQLDGSIGKLPITDIAPIDVLEAVRRIERKGNLESARRTLQLAGAVFRYAVATARIPSDPTRDLRGALLTPKVTHYGAITDPEKVGELLRAIDAYDGFGITKQALLLSAHVFVRPGELRHALWSEIDLDESVWTIPAEKMKMRKPHHVPLSKQVVELLKDLRCVTGPNGFVFPSVRSRARPMSENTLNGGLRRLGYTTHEMTGHGFRAMASTLLNESGKWSSDAIERALAHGDKDKVRAAYHRGTHWKERVQMAQWWSDYIDKLRDNVNNKSMRRRLAAAA